VTTFQGFKLKLHINAIDASVIAVANMIEKIKKKINIAPAVAIRNFNLKH
jgi:hypothetical protein